MKMVQRHCKAHSAEAIQKHKHRHCGRNTPLNPPSRGDTSAEIPPLKGEGGCSGLLRTSATLSLRNDVL